VIHARWLKKLQKGVSFIMHLEEKKGNFIIENILRVRKQRLTRKRENEEK
jgi:hypothetical protein